MKPFHFSASRLRLMLLVTTLSLPIFLTCPPIAAQQTSSSVTRRVRRSSIHTARKRQDASRFFSLRGNPRVSQTVRVRDRWFVDYDDDDIDDGNEQRLAEKFAPIIYHESGDPNLPTNVEWFLARTEMRFYDHTCGVAKDVPVENGNPPTDMIFLYGFGSLTNPVR